jgi:hypothetical protein
MLLLFVLLALGGGAPKSWSPTSCIPRTYSQILHQAGKACHGQTLVYFASSLSLIYTYNLTLQNDLEMHDFKNRSLLLFKQCSLL